MINTSNFAYYMPVHVYFGLNRTKDAGKLVREVGTKALLVTGKTSMKRLGVLDKVVQSLNDNSVETILFDQIVPNPTNRIADEGAAIAKKNHCDVIIGFGGGSAMDTAKGIAVVASLGGNLWDYIGERKVKKEVIPIVTVPTTAGTGSETTPYAVFTNPAIRRKDAIVSPMIFPKVAILDPVLMQSMSQEITADTGFDALGHAIEAYMSSSANPFSESCSIESVSLIADALVRAAKNGDDLRSEDENGNREQLGWDGYCSGGRGCRPRIRNEYWRVVQYIAWPDSRRPSPTRNVIQPVGDSR